MNRSDPLRAALIVAVACLSASSAPCIAASPALSVSIDAALLARQKPEAAVATLRTLGWSQVTYNSREGLIALKAKDGSSGLVQYRKRVLLFAAFNVPSRPSVTTDLVRSAFRLKALPPPSQQWPSGLRWRLTGPTLREIEAYVTNVTTNFGVKYASEHLIKQWESE